MIKKLRKYMILGFQHSTQNKDFFLRLLKSEISVFVHSHKQLFYIKNSKTIFSPEKPTCLYGISQTFSDSSYIV